MKSDISIPTPESAVFESTVYRLRHHPVEFVSDLVHRYGDIVRVPFGDQGLYFLNHPDFLADMFVNKPAIFGKRKDPDSEQHYLEQIAGLVPLMRHETVPGYAPLVLQAAERADERWSRRFAESGPFETDMYREIGRLTLEVVCEILFQACAHSQSAALMDAIVTMDVGHGFNPIEATLAGFLPSRDVPMSAESQAARAYIEAFVQQIADREAASPSGSLLGAMIQNLSMKQVVPAAMQIMFGMHEVTATTMPWTWYLLSEHPEVESQLHAELDRVVGRRLPTVEDLERLPYTNAVLKEARRLYPSVWIIARFLREDFAFHDRPVPKGSIVMASQRVMHYDARFFPDPERFDPGRWTKAAVASRPEYAYFPFSGGPRACAGKEFAILQDMLVTSLLAQRWKASLVPGQILEAVPQKSSAPRHGIRMIIERRS